MCIIRLTTLFKNNSELFQENVYIEQMLKSKIDSKDAIYIIMFDWTSFKKYGYYPLGETVKISPRSFLLAYPGSAKMGEYNLFM
jgi:hypothetical protein